MTKSGELSKTECLKRWIKSEMQPEKQYLIKSKEMRDIVKELIICNFGWPKFFLQLSKDLLGVTKYELITKTKN